MEKLLIFLLIVGSLFCQEYPSELSIEAFVNDKAIAGKVYNNPFGAPIHGVNYYSSFVDLNEIFKLLQSDIEFKDDVIKISNTYVNNLMIHIKKMDNLKVSVNQKGEEIILPNYLSKDMVKLIENKFYIQISIVRYLIDGALKQNDTQIILYTPDYERLDIPSSLSECYSKLDEKLSTKDISEIKNSDINNLGKYHFGLGLWIRNNWIYPTPNRISKIFIENGIRHPDHISGYIITGYHYYLNGTEKELDELLLLLKK